MKKENFIPSDVTYFNTAGDGLMNKEIYHKLDHIRDQFKDHFYLSRKKFLLEDVDNIRKLAAKYVNCDINEMALTQSFSIGFNYLLPSLSSWKKILLLENDYPSLWMPLGLSDAEISYVSMNSEFTFSAERIIDRAKEVQPEIIALSHVQYSTGYMADIKTIGEYCHANNIIFIVDGTQALGCVPIDFSQLKIDVYAASTYKWLCAGHGCGLMYVNQNFQNKIRFKTGGYMAWYTHGDNWKTDQTLLNLEVGHKDHESFYRLKYALEEALSRNTDETLNHNRSLISELKELFISLRMEIVTHFSESETAGILIVKDSGGITEKLNENGIYTTTRNGNIRFSCHFYNDVADINRLRAILNS